MDVPADATGVVGECTGAGALRLPGSPAPAVLVMYCRMVVVGGDSGMVVHFGISACDASHPRRSSPVQLIRDGELVPHGVKPGLQGARLPS